MVGADLKKYPACQRCHKRKKKCDSKLPSCSRCFKANTECLIFDKVLGRTLPRQSLGVDKGLGHNNSVEMTATNLNLSLKLDRKSPENGYTVQKRQKVASPQYSLASSPEFNNYSEESYAFDPMSVSTLFASNSKSTNSVIDRDLEHEIKEYPESVTTRGVREAFIANELKAIAGLERDILKAYRKNIVQNKATDVAAYDHALLKRVCKRYFTWMNSAYPVLHEITTFELFEKSWSDKTTDFEQFQVKMVIAIALGSVSRPHISNSEIGQVSKMFWKSAMNLFNRANSGIDNLQNLQKVLLLLQYTLLVPETGNLWQLSGTAMRYATSMSLYTEPNPSQSFDPLTLDLRRRMFWTCYCIDRSLSTVMGPPTTVPDSWITAQLPSIYEDKLITVNGINAGPACNLKVGMVLHVGICRLQSEIHARLYGPVDSRSSQIDVEDQITWTWNMYDRLRLWRHSFLLPTPLIMKEWVDFQFHLSVVLLLRPLPSRPIPSDEELHVAFHSAGEVMKLVKIMHRDQLAEFTWLTVQNLFMCGLTFIKSLREFSNRSPPRPLCISFVDIVLQVQACTSMLETLSALKPGGDDKMRNVFEVISSNTLHDLAKKCSDLQKITFQCYWEVLAKSDNLRLQRPVEIDGVKIPIENVMSVPSLYGADDPRLQDLDEHHFYEHDTDAQMSMLDSHSEYSFYENGESYFRSVISQRNSHDTEVAPTIFGMDGLAAISTVASEAEPLVAAFSEYATGHDQTTELDRWFFYPI